MANYKVFSDITEITSVHGRVSVITTDSCSCVNPIPDGINIDVYQDGEKVEDAEQYFETSDIGDDILDADLEEEVYIQEDAESTYNTMCELAEVYRDVNGNLDLYSEAISERMHLYDDDADSESEEDE